MQKTAVAAELQFGGAPELGVSCFEEPGHQLLGQLDFHFGGMLVPCFVEVNFEGCQREHLEGQSLEG